MISYLYESAYPDKFRDPDNLINIYISAVVGLVEALWKLIGIIINGRLQQPITLHNYLHGFWDGMGVKNSIIEENLNQKLAALQKSPLYQIYMDLGND